MYTVKDSTTTKPIWERGGQNHRVCGDLHSVDKNHTVNKQKMLHGMREMIAI